MPTGIPGLFRCASCRKRFGTGPLGPRGEHGWMDEIVLLGDVKAVPPSAPRKGSSMWLVRYECLFCGHRGWSRHPQVERRAVKEGLLVRVNSWRVELPEFPGVHPEDGQRA